MVIRGFVLLFCSLLVLKSGSLFSQKRDTLRLREVEIKASFTPRTEGFKKIRIDSSLLIPQLNTDLSTILSQHSTIFIKTYGNGSLATPSLRGTSSSHTEVEWNGISINSPMLGMTDFSQVPAFQFNSVEVLYGAAGITKTAGAFGGVINLVTEPDWQKKLNILASQTTGSFDTYTDNFSLTTGNEKIQSVSKIYYNFSKNNFPYNVDGQELYQEHGEYTNYGGSEEIFLKLDNKNYFSGRIWYNYSFLNIPPALTVQFWGTETQENKDVYSKVEWKHLGKNNLLTVWSGMVDHSMNYFMKDSANSHHNSYSWLNRLRWSYSGFKYFSIKPGLDYTYDWVISDKYLSKVTRGTVSAFSEFILKYPEKFSFNLVLREEYLENQFLPLIAALGGEYDPLKSHRLSVSFNLAKNYKYPSLNDLYWEYLGNPELKPETDYSGEAGLIYRLLSRNKVFFLETELTGYYSKMYDLIMWTPTSGKWRPANVAEVLARGIEAGANFRIEKKNFSVFLNNNYHYCRSTNEEASVPQDTSTIGKQLIYIPVHTFNTTLLVNISDWYGSANYSYFSERFTSTTNDSYMPGYGISNIILGKNFHLEKILLSLQLQINNLFDLDYQSIANRPMPGRNMAVSLKINFRK